MIALEFVGDMVIYFARTIWYFLTGKLNYFLTSRQMSALGVNSIPLAMLVMGFVGATVSYLLAEELGKRGASAYVGGILLLALLRELIPLLTGVVLAGKAGAAITSEIGSMRITSQIDALRALSTDPHWFLTAPRVFALLVMSPVVGVFAGFAGFLAGYYMAFHKIGLSYAAYTANIAYPFVKLSDFRGCLVKLLIFGAVVAIVGCFMGYQVKRGAEDVGRAVTNSVVLSIVLIFGLDLLLLPVLF
ncbi:MAG: hypothetical protein B1H03_03270 [Planctomycetales bacterium 4484_113]|nr:MAG: hypothetical protein B1H03_03270 [Planctomycetales bacterium 4484_113]